MEPWNPPPRFSGHLCPFLHTVSDIGRLEIRLAIITMSPLYFPSGFAALDKMKTISTLVSYKSLGYLTLGGVFTACTGGKIYLLVCNFGIYG